MRKQTLGGSVYSQRCSEKYLHWNTILTKEDPKIEGIRIRTSTEKLKEYCVRTLSAILTFDEDLEMVHGTIKKYDPLEIDYSINCRMEKFNLLSKILAEGCKKLDMTYSGVIRAFKGYKEKQQCLVKFNILFARGVECATGC